MLLLASCAQPLPPGEEGRREASVPAVPPLVRHVPNEVVRTTWTFRSSDEECTAIAAASGTSLQVTRPPRCADPPRRRPRTGASPATGDRSASLHRIGRILAGHRPRAAARQFTVALGSDETALSRILVLLSGGTLELGRPAQPIVSLAISPSDTQGQTWFDCARGKML